MQSPSNQALGMAVAAVVERAGGPGLTCIEIRAVGGGCIDRCFEIHGANQRFFAKVSETARARDRFAAEADGLGALQQSGAFRVPAVVGLGKLDTGAVLVLEHVALRTLDTTGQALAGRALARQHRTIGPYFGWGRDNYLGRTPQPNDPTDNWLAFFSRQRLVFQLRRLQESTANATWVARGLQLADRLDHFFSGYTPLPSLLHGDCWGGNVAADEGGTPVVYDPAVHYGDRECDLAMTHLFGGFSADFYRAYEQEWPLHEGYRQRLRLYQLYHVLNHANLFGGGYINEAESLVNRLWQAGGKESRRPAFIPH